MEKADATNKTRSAREVFRSDPEQTLSHEAPPSPLLPSSAGPGSRPHKEQEIGIVAFVPDLWEDYWMPRHHILSRLSRHYKVLWVSPPLYWRRAVIDRSAVRRTRGVRKLTNSFWIYAPEVYFSAFYKPRPLSRFFESIRLQRIKSLLSAMDIARPVLYIWRPEFECYLRKFNEALSIYHIDDEYSFSDIDVPVSQSESTLLKNADVVLIHSKTLLKKKGMFNPNTFYVPNGVDFNHYQRVAQHSKTHPHEFASIPRPRIGYVGHIKKQIDLKLLLEMARRRKDWSLVLVGPVNQNHPEITEPVELLQREDNVHFLGGKNPAELPAYIKEMDVCLMCYKKTSYTNYIYPMKLHEYLACGKPVVATQLENLMEFRSVLSFADGPEEWIDQVHKALTDAKPELELRRMKVAEQNSWEARAKFIRSIIAGTISNSATLHTAGAIPRAS